MKCVVLAAGEGKRMHTLTFTRPKVMLPIANKPILEWNLLDAIKAGIKEFVFVVGYKSEMVRSYFGDGSQWNVSIDYVNALRARGIDARYVEVPGVGHNAGPLFPAISKAIFNQIPTRPAFAGEFDELKERLKSGDEEFLKQWQTYFLGIGLYSGSIDGSYGRMTELAISKCETIDECRKGD